MTEPGNHPAKAILWVLGGCAAFVAVGIWLTRPPSDAEERASSDDRYDVPRNDTFEDAWRTVWNSDSPAGSEPVSKDDDATTERRARPAVAGGGVVSPGTTREEKSSNREKKQPGAEDPVVRVVPGEERDDTGRGRAGDGSVLAEAPSSEPGDSPIEVAALNNPLASEDLSDLEISDFDIEPRELESTNSGAPASSGSSGESQASPGSIASPTVRSDPALDDLDEDVSGLPSAVESRVVTLRVSGSLGGKPINPKHGYTWGRLGYFFQRELNPPYFLVFPGGGVPSVIKPPAASPRAGPVSGRRVTTGRQTLKGLPAIRPGGTLGPPLFVVDISAGVESAGAVTFYGRGVAQKWRCRVDVQIYYLGGEAPAVVESFSVSETTTAVQGRGVAAGPPGEPVYQAAIEKLVKRLRSSRCFR